MKIMLTQKPGHECSKQLSLKYLHTVTKPRVFQWVNGQSRLWSIHTNECYSSCNNLSEYPNNYTEKKVNPQILHYTIPLTFHSWSDKIIKNKEQVSDCSDKNSVKMQRGKLDSFHYTKISFKWIKDLNIKAETIKLLEENIMKKASWQMALAVISWIWHQKHRWQEKKIDKWNDIKLKNFYTANETINKIKRWPVEWEKIFPIYISVWWSGSNS